VYGLSAGVEMLFAEEGGRVGDAGGATARRVRAAAAAGLPAVEIWGWRGKDADALGRALNDTGTLLQTVCVDPMVPLADPADHGAFLAAIRESADAAERWGCPYLVVTAGRRLPGVPLPAQRAAVEEALRAAGRLLSGRPVTLLLENLNSRVDHPGTLLDATADCLDAVAGADSPRVRLLFDLYHAAVMGERPADVLAGRAHLVGHVQVADTPGRGEPGSGRVDWRAALGDLRTLGYTGRIGLEYAPTVATPASLAVIRALAAEA
jgi:hydroxypyruvate isomerase